MNDFNHLSELSLQVNNIGKNSAISPASDILFYGNKTSDAGEMDSIERIAKEQ